MKEVRFGIIGVGGMGTSHANKILAGDVPRGVLKAVCDVNPERFDPFGDGILKFEDSRRLIRSGEVDAVLIATPHYDHTTIGIDALQQGLHVLTEKPISVHKADCERLIAAYKNRPRKAQVFAAMFNVRTTPVFQKTRELVQKGELGEFTRVNWIITNWFRTQAYYDGGGWRATWKGEGGGVLLNQCPHQLDLLQWICGLPCRVRGFCGFGKRHHIEVEDEVTAYLEYDNGATGVFVTGTGEAPGTNRLEICGERGKLVVEHGELHFIRNEVPMSEFGRASTASFDRPPVWNVEIPISGTGGQHVEIMRNFVDAILDKTPLIAPAEEGIRSVELGNAMLLSSLTGKTVDLPMNGAAFERRLKKLIRESTFQKKAPAGKAKPTDLSGTFNIT